MRILVACGSGVATSTLAADRIKEVCRERGLDPEILKCTIQEIPSLAPQCDIIVTTTRYSEVVGKPVINGVAFITGINEEKAIKELIEAVQGIKK
ncbi:MAG TPA: PTS sugar transporter subunit IIB [Firmicutes bacterium]|nr:PTS sugar transporter subunit IIB [Candidatus Fermentithermobacillaceae bacterium]